MLVVIALIPLILSIGILPAIIFSDSIDSPRKQMTKGIHVEDVICKGGFTLMIRISGDAACVTSTTAEKLQVKGWGTIEKEFKLEPKTMEVKIIEDLGISDESSTEDSKKVTNYKIKLEESANLKGN